MAEDTDRRSLSTAVIILTAVLLVLTALFLLEPQVATEKENTYESLVKNLFDEVLEGVEDLRGLTRPADIELNVVSIQWFRDREKQKVSEDVEEIKLEDIVYRALFLIPPDYSVGEARVEEASRIISAVVGVKLYVVQEYFKPQDTQAARRTLAHEITHVLQSKFRPPRTTTFDQKQAWRALVEGDADFTADKYAAISESPSDKATVLGGLRKIRAFPYRYGSGFVSALYMAGGWSLVNSAYERPPRSTEEVLHSEVYLAGGSFIDVEALTPESDEWVAVLTDTYGEYFIQVMLENGVPGDEAAMAAAGWGGDNLTLFQRSESHLVTWRINWDTEEDAFEFFEAYKRMVVQMGGEEVEYGLYRLHDHYVAFAKHGEVIELASSTDRQSVTSVMRFMTS